ncbi:hypothetical protein AX774_g4001 [Zancudomyces culisetae]|uniref:Chromatin assembly factor 1 subunit A dimerization domain-containing protein n=1 Tax=Zancudomyces culisetae TaxID=1213189 RepID=A0A1R1PNI6_ZANCU|nr:hypothetical protein AX774_g4001 [Zancudomyces culisetae]|eukprot:OMH82520.1 hypothetical protein AX774_g4001 [Zancudomyces culisetae]
MLLLFRTLRILLDIIDKAKEDCRLLVGRSEVKQQRVDGETLEIQEEKSSELEKTEERMDDAIEQSIEQSIEHDSTGQGKRQTLLNVFFGSRALKGNRGGGVTLGKPVERFRDFFIKPNVVMGNGSKFLSEEKKKQIVNRMDLELNQPTELTNEQIIYELKQIGRLARQRIRQTLQENYRQRVDEMELGQELGPVAIGNIKILGDTGSARPFYMGPWDKSAKVVNGRRPFVKETSGEVDYDVDSSVEWEMNAALEDAEGEDLVSEEGSEEEEEEEEEGGDNDNSETEEMDGWLVDENVVVREAENNTSDSDEDDSDFDINKPIVPEELSDVESGYGSDFDMDIDQNEETIDEKLIRDLKQAKTFRNDGSDKYVIKPRRKHPKTVPVTRKKLVHLTTTVIGPVFDNSNDFLNDFAVVQFPKFRPAAPQKVPDVPVNTTNPVPVKKEPPPKFEFNKNAKRRISAIVSGSDLSLKILVEKIKQAYPMASKIQIQAYIQSNYQKFKKNASNKPRWHNSKIYNQASAKQNSSIGENDSNKKRKSSALLDDSGPRNTVPIIPICVKKDNGGENKNTKSSLYSYFSKS